MILSRTMRMSDYVELAADLGYVDSVATAVGGLDPAQTPYRRWEYATALRAVQANFGEVIGVDCRAADFGCGIGLLSPILLSLNWDVSMYEVWVYGDQEAQALRQMLAAKSPLGQYRMIHRPLCGLTDEDRHFDAAFCISTLEHIGEYERAFRDLCQSVRPGGLIFLTTDFAEDETDHYQLAYMRAGRMFTAETYGRLVAIAADYDCSLLGGESDWSWSEENRLVLDYGFASLALTKRSALKVAA